MRFNYEAEKEAAKRKKRLRPDKRPAGSAVEFIALYDRNQAQCNKMLPEKVLNQLHENKGKRFELTIELLHQQYPLLRPLIGDMIRIHRYYECMVNCAPLDASQEMCALARRALPFLEGLSHK